MASAYHDEPQDDIMGIVDELVGEDGDMMAAASSHRHYQTAHCGDMVDIGELLEVGRPLAFTQRL